MAVDQSKAIAMIYAEALFELGHHRQESKKLHLDLKLMAQTVLEHRDLRVFLDSPAINRQQKEESILRIFDGRVGKLTCDFLKVLAGKDRLNLIRQIQNSYEELEDAKAGRIKGTLTTAVELSDNEQSRLGEQVGRALRKDVILQTRVDPAIIGGMVLKVEDTLMDASIKGSLEQFSQKLSREVINKL